MTNLLKRLRLRKKGTALGRKDAPSAPYVPPDPDGSGTLSMNFSIPANSMYLALRALGRR